MRRFKAERERSSGSMGRLTDLQKEQVEMKLMFGAVDRAAIICLFFAFAFPIYSLTSFQFTLKIDPTVQMWPSLWPHLFYSGLPFAAMSWFFKKYRSRTKLKMWIWTLGYPIILGASNTIQIFPLMAAGHPEIYLNIHAACFVATIMAMTLVAPPPKYLYWMIALTVLTYVTPVCWLFYKAGDLDLIRFLLNDAAYSFFLTILSAKTTFGLRSRLAKNDVLNQQKIEKFVGNIVSQSIFENNEALLDTRSGYGFLISLDVRGFTQVTKSMDSAVARKFKEGYHRLVASVVGERGGFIHKTHGDGHLISLGLMNAEDNSFVGNEVGGADGQLAQKRASQLRKAIAIFENVFEQFELLKKELNIDPRVCVCASIDYGEIGLSILGDPNVRLEFDIEGIVVIRCARLESFTKTLREVFSQESSYLVVSSSASSYQYGNLDFHVFRTDRYPVKDFPDEKYVTYREYLSKQTGLKGTG